MVFIGKKSYEDFNNISKLHVCCCCCCRWKRGAKRCAVEDIDD
jgi:hypothetical protein